MLEFVCFTLQKWFFERRIEAEKCKGPLSKAKEKYLRNLSDEAPALLVYPVSQYEITVIDGDLDGEVNLQNRSCSCRRFDLTGLPCEHALAGARDCSINPYTLCSRYYTVEAWLASYTENIFPLGNEETWDVPDHIKQLCVLPPLVKPKVGRPKKNRIKSKSEHHVIQRRCSR